MTQHSDLFAALAAPFESHEIKVRSQQGRQLYYITARTCMNRLDNVLGPENWYDQYEPHENHVLCKLTIRLPDGQLLTKCDAGGYAGMADSGDDDKSGYSDAFKRACVKFGVGRYLYRDGVPSFVQERTAAVESMAATPPAAVESAAQGTRAATNGQSPGSVAKAVAAPSVGNVPRTGRALFAWTREQEQRHEVGLLKHLNGWAKLQDFPARMVEWNADQVSQAYSEACRKLPSLQSGRSEAYEEALAN
jgi:hypothetical protein